MIKILKNVYINPSTMLIMGSKHKPEDVGDAETIDRLIEDGYAEEVVVRKPKATRSKAKKATSSLEEKSDVAPLV